MSDDESRIRCQGKFSTENDLKNRLMKEMLINDHTKYMVKPYVITVSLDGKILDGEAKFRSVVELVYVGVMYKL